MLLLSSSLSILLVLMVLCGVCYMLAFFVGAPFVPTPMHVIVEMIKIAKIGKHDVVFDLGSGDGRMLIESAKKGAQTRGWEINPFLVVWTKMLAQKQGVSKNVSVYCQTYQKAKLKDATVIFLYNIPGFLPSLEKEFKKQLKPGTKIFSYKFPLQTFTPIKKTSSGIFYYKKP